MPELEAGVIAAELVRGRAGEDALKLFAVLDGARDKGLVPLLDEHDPPRECLFAGALPERLRASAPWLVALEDERSPLALELLARGWGESWGVYLLSAASLGQLRKHLRRFLEVYRESGAKLFFRFFDPRVTRAYLPTCTREELDFVFGPISQLLVEGADPAELERLTLDEEDGLTREVAQLGEPAAAPSAAGEPAAPAEPTLGPEDVERLLEHLQQAPGDEGTLAALRALAARHWPEVSEEAGALVTNLVELEEAARVPSKLGPLLGAVATGGWKAAFAALAPALHGRLDPLARAQLQAASAVLVDVDALVEETQDLRTRLREASELKDAEAERRGVTAALRALHGFAERSAAWGVPAAEDPRAVKAREAVSRVLARVEGADPSARRLTASLTSMLVGLERGSREENRATARAARGLTLALTATGATGSAAPGPRERRRYTARRRALPFERRRLVIRDEQLEALARAMRHGLIARLIAWARDTHAEQAAALGPERLREVVELCLDKADGWEIQRVPAIEALLHLMLVIDPEFTELEDYAWAKELLENEMLDPNTRPLAVLAELEG